MVMGESMRSQPIYEIDEKGQRVMVRSLESTSRAYLRFTNKTTRPVDVWWRDFHGTRRHYVRLNPGKFYDINSFITHPWEFTDLDTGESFRINNKTVFRPPPNIGGMMYRTNWNITIGVRTLRHTVLLAIANKIDNPDKLNALGLPRVLAQELLDLANLIHKKPAVSPERD